MKSPAAYSAFFCSTALALLAAASPSRADTAADGATVEQVVVTASKRAETVQTAPVAITAVTDDTLKSIGATNFEDFANYVPGLNFVQQGGPGRHQLVLRGVTTGDSGNATVGVLVDDVPYGATGGKANGARLALDLATFDLDRIEVLRGPQGTLYGALTMGGLLKYVTKQPDPGGFAAALEAGTSKVEQGTWGYDLKGMVNIPMSDKAALRIVAMHDDSPNYTDNLGTGQDNAYGYKLDGVRAALLVKPTDDLRITLSALGQNISQTDQPVVDINVLTHQPIYCDLCHSTPGHPYFKQQYRLYSANADLDLHFATLTSITSYSTIDSNLRNDLSEFLRALLPFGPVGYYSDVPYFSTKATQELRLTSPSGQRLEWLVGGYYDRESTSSPQNVYAFDPATGAPAALPPLLSGEFPSNYREYAAFGDLTYHFTPQFDATAGVRYSHNSQHFEQHQTGLLVNPTSANLTGESSDSATTYMFNARYRLTPEKMLYARVASGYRPGGANLLNPLAPVPHTYGPDKLWNYEVGAKTEWLDGKLSVNLSAFWIDWSNIQISVITAGFGHTENGGEARSRGFEFETQLRPISGLTLGFNAAYTDAEMTKLAPGANIGAAVGDPLPQTPKWSAAATGDWNFPLGGTLVGSVGASYRYVGSRFEAFPHTPGVFPFEARSYDLVDLRAGVAMDRYRLTFFVKNVGDVRGEVRANTNQVTNPATTPAQLFITEPRTFGATVSAEF